MEKDKVCIQGYEGSFHQIAAREYMGNDIGIISCNSFREVVKIASDSRKVTGGFMAIENSIAGSILPNYNLLQDSGLNISGEIYLQINQNLMAIPGIREDDICEVHSHPMALLQCMDFLEQHPKWKLVETEDTALSAKNISQNKSRNIAVIASSLAAEIYHLNILASKIQLNQNNYTRFLFIQPSQIIAEEANKASIIFHTDHSRGSLVKVLEKIAEEEINLSKLQSMPIPEKEWKYRFHVDIEFTCPDQFFRMMEKIKPVTQSLKALGIYKTGKTIKK